MTASKIEWTDRSDWNPIRGCTRVSPGCGGPGKHGGCYAEAMAARFSQPGMWGHGYAEMVSGQPRWTGKVELQANRLLLPLSWRKPAKVFASSTSDIFHEALPDAAIDRIFAVMALCPHLTFQILTKRPKRMRDYFKPLRTCRPREDIIACEMARIEGKSDLDRRTPAWPLPNVWLGVSAERQQEADERIPLLLQTPAAIRFISAEPLLGPIDLSRCGSHYTGSGPLHLWRVPGTSKWHRQHMQPPPEIDWVIAGGESGPRARPMHPDWARSLRDQCAMAGVPFFFKQWGEWNPAIDRDAEDPDWRRDYAVVDSQPRRFRIHNFAGGTGFHGDRVHLMERAGKALTGALLDGREHKAFPESRP